MHLRYVNALKVSKTLLDSYPMKVQITPTGVSQPRFPSWSLPALCLDSLFLPLPFYQTTL